MPNTVIALKKSATPSAAPASLANGELAINFADGKLYYKHANGTIAAISSGGAGDSFGTVNAAGTLIIADTAGDILTLEAGSGITITGDAINDKITIAATTVDISPAFTQANTARDHANAAFLEANTAETIAIASFGQANTARTHANTAHASANAGMAIANGAFASANAGQATANAAFNRANTANITADRAWNHANAAFATVNSAFVVANASFSHANAAFATVNSAFGVANTALPNTSGVSFVGNLNFPSGSVGIGTSSPNWKLHIADSIAPVIQLEEISVANTFIGQDGNVFFIRRNTIGTTSAITIDASSNVLIGRQTSTVGSDVKLDVAGAANASNLLVNGNMVFTAANDGAGSNLDADLLDGQQGSYYGIATDVTAAFGQANTARTHANAAFAHANAAFLSSNSVNTFSNATYVKLTAASQTITGNLNIVGDLTLSGNTFAIDATRLEVDDPLLYLAANNYTSDIVDIGFIANYVNATGQNVHTGLYREHTDKMYYLFQGYDQEPVNNHIGALSNNMTLAVLNADIRTSNLVLGGANAILTIGASFNHANAAHASANAGMAIANGAFAAANAGLLQANTARNHANTAHASANAGLLQANTARDHANTAHASANAGMAIANGAFASANAGQATANAAFNRANTANITADRAWNHANAAFATINSAFGVANTALPNTSGVSFNGSLNFPSGNIVVGAAGLQGFKFAVLGGALGTGAGNTVNAWSSSATTTNGDKLVHIIERNADGVDWTTANHKLARIVDVTTMGYMKFGSFSTDLITFGEGSTEYLRIDGSGNVGIGNTSPTAKLQVNGQILGMATGGGEGGEISLNNPGNSNTGLIIDVAFTNFGRIFQTENNSTLQIGQLAGTGGLVTFSTAATERMRIDSSGRVGIGTTSLDESFQVAGAISTSGVTLANKTSAATFDFSTGFNSGRILAWGSVGSVANITFWSGSGAGGATERMRIDPTGNLLIGRTNSTVGQGIKLDVNGGINASAVLVNGAAIESGISTGKAIAMAIVFG